MVNTPEKESSLVLGFGPTDMKGVVAPHNDALIIRATMANYEVARIFVDANSSISILFRIALKQMGLNE